MSTQFENLGNLCTITMGYPASRARKKGGGLEGVGKMLIPRAMAGGMIVDSELVQEQTAGIKDEFFTHEMDLVLKLSTPYDCVLVDSQHEGILVTSFAVIIRPRKSAAVDIRYLAAFLSMPQTKDVLQSMGTGISISLLKKGTLEALPIPLIPLEQQQKLAQLFENTQLRKNNYRKAMALSDQLLESEFAHAVFFEGNHGPLSERKS